MFGGVWYGCVVGLGGCVVGFEKGVWWGLRWGVVGNRDGSGKECGGDGGGL